MLRSRLFVETRAAIADTVRGKDGTGFLNTALLLKGLLLLLGLGLGVFLAWSIVGEQWALVIGLLLFVPALILFNTYPFAAIIIWIMFMPFLQTTSNSGYRQTYYIVHRALPLVALGLTVLAKMLKVAKNRQPLRLGWADLAIALYLGLALVNILYFQPTPLPDLYLFYDQLFVPICLYFFVRVVAPSEQDIKRLMPIALILVLVEVTVGILSWFAPQVLPPEWLTAEGSRTIGTLRYPHAYTTTLVFFCLLLFQNAMQRNPGLVRSILLFTTGFGAVGVFLSFSRGSWLGGLAAAIGLLFMYPKVTVRLTVILLIVMSILGSGVLSKQMVFAQERMNSEDTANDRWVIWDAGLQMIEAKPLFGWGYETYTLYAWQFQRRVNNYVAANPHASHNSYIAIAAELGLPGFFLFAFPVLWWLTLTLKVWPRLPKEGFWSRSLLIVFWMVILNHVVVCFFSDMSNSTIGMGMWWMTLGLIATMVDTYRQPADMRLPTWARRASQAT